jgi:excisionase family DNA binding protein
MDKELETLCTVKEACYTEKAGRTTVYKRIKLGFYKAYKIGGSTRLSVASLKAYRQQFQPTAAAAISDGGARE